MSEHTPGPWHCGEQVDICQWIGVYAGPGDDIIICDVLSEDLTIKDQCMANARLIAASPEMLAVCQKLAVIEAGTDGCSRDEDTGTLWEAVQLARAVLARVKGGT